MTFTCNRIVTYRCSDSRQVVIFAQVGLASDIVSSAPGELPPPLLRNAPGIVPDAVIETIEV